MVFSAWVSKVASEFVKWKANFPFADWLKSEPIEKRKTEDLSKDNIILWSSFPPLVIAVDGTLTLAKIVNSSILSDSPLT